jgi:hypothetical protein
MAAIDKDVRRHIVNVVAGDSATGLALIAAPVDRLGHLAFELLSDYQTDNPVLVVFGLVAVVLFAFLFRS